MLVYFRWKNERGEWQQQDMTKEEAVEILSGGYSDGHAFLTSKADYEEGTIPMTLTFIHATGQAEVFDKNMKQRLLKKYPTWAIKPSTTERGRCTTIGPKKYVDDLDELD